jgi:hypothetical protein
MGEQDRWTARAVEVRSDANVTGGVTIDNGGCGPLIANGDVSIQNGGTQAILAAGGARVGRNGLVGIVSPNVTVQEGGRVLVSSPLVLAAGAGGIAFAPLSRLVRR